MDVQGPVIVTYVYQLVDGEVSPDFRSSASVSLGSTEGSFQVKVDKVEYRRPDQPRQADQAPAHRPEVAAGW